MKKLINLIAFAALLVAPAVATAQCDDGELQCSVTIVATDGYGDGWNGAQISVYQGETLRGTVTVPNDGGSGHGDIPHTFEVPVCSGDSVRFEWTSGQWDSECSYTILNGNDDTIHTGSGAMPTISAMPVCPTCIKVFNLSVSDRTNEGATISWVGNETAQGYLVYLNGELTSDSPVADTFYTFNGLEANTEYAVSVRTYCGDEDTAVAVNGSFHTDCENGSCNITVVCGSQYSGYGPSVNVLQGGGVIASVSGTQTIEICNGDSVYVVLTSAGNYTPTLTVRDVADIELFSGSTASHSAGDTMVAVANGCPSCMPVESVYSSEVGSYTAHIGWADDDFDGSNTYAIYVGGELVDIVSGDTVYDLSNLSASTTLTVGVSRICDEGDTSGARTTTFRTACGAVSLPYFEDFSGLGFDASNGLPVPCWIAYYTCTTGGRTFPCGSADGSNPTMAFTADPGMTIFIATDTIPVSGDSVFVSFRAQPNGNVDFWCGVMSDPYDSTTFIPIGNGIHTTNANNTWGEYVFSTVGFSPDTSYRVAFKYRGTGYTGNWVNVDDIEIRVFDGCIRPMDLEAGDITAESAVLDWQVNGSEDSWLLTVNGEASIITEKPYTLEGLEANTVYSITLAALCQSGDTTDAISTSFRTPCAGDTCVVTVSTTSYYLSEYELIQNGYSFGLTDNAGAYQVCNGQEVYLHTTDASGYTMSIVNAAGIELFNGTPNDATADTLSLGQPCPSCMPAVNLAVSDISATGATFSWQPMGTEGNEQSWTIFVDGEEVGTSNTTSFNLTGLTANTEYTVGVRANCSDGDSSVLRTTTMRTACEGGNCEFTVEMSDSYSGLDGWNGAAVEIYQNGTLFQSLTIASGSNSNTVTASPCLGDEVVLLWHSGQYDYEASFTVSKDDSVLFASGSMSGHSTGDSIMTFNGQCEATVIMTQDTTQPQPTTCDAPQSLNATPAETSVSITYISSVYDYEVGIVEGSSWNEAAADIDETNNNLYTFTSLDAGTTYTIGVRAVCGYYEYSDWVTTTVTTTGGNTPGPQPEECNAPTNVQAVNVDTNRAVITWTAGGNETEWQLMVNNDEQNLIDASGNASYVMNSLTPATAYKVRVRAVCSATATSDWSTELTFTTDSVHQGGNEGIESADGIAASLYPNPAASVVSIEADEETMVSIVDLNGREVYRSTEAATMHRVDVSHMAKGAYFVRIVTDDGAAVRKLIVK